MQPVRIHSPRACISLPDLCCFDNKHFTIVFFHLTIFEMRD